MPGMKAIGGLEAVTIDCADPVAIAGFWAAVFGSKLGDIDGDPARYVDVEPVPGVPLLCFQRVPEAKAVKNRVHLDVTVDDVEAATVRIEKLGGTRIDQDLRFDLGVQYRVVADPEGNEFCLVHLR
jgi:predicted enzyme related to lactoylglutathione lyase